MKEQPKIIIDPTLETRKLDGYYFVHGHCSNCKQADRISLSGAVDVMIKEGTLKPTEPMTCPNCKNQTLTV